MNGGFSRIVTGRSLLFTLFSERSNGAECEKRDRLVARSWKLIACRCSQILALVAAGHAALDRGALLIVVPGIDHQERQRMVGWEIATIEVEGIFQGLAAAGIHFASLPPLGFGVVKTRPRGADCDLVRLVGQSFVEVFQVRAP